jgi:predicted aldo/keto reductase-like oxidoreductase
MSTLSQLQDNLTTFSKEEPLTGEEKALLDQVVCELTDMVPCTACRYCMDACPKKLEIPKLLSMYNEIRFDNPSTLRFTLDAMPEEEKPGACLGCGECAKLCPQGIDIPANLKKFDEKLAGTKN